MTERNENYIKYNKMIVKKYKTGNHLNWESYFYSAAVSFLSSEK